MDILLIYPKYYDSLKNQPLLIVLGGSGLKKKIGQTT